MMARAGMGTVMAALEPTMVGSVKVTVSGPAGRGAGMVKFTTPKAPELGVTGSEVVQVGPPLMPMMSAVKVTVSSAEPGPFSTRSTFVGPLAWMPGGAGAKRRSCTIICSLA